jgi:hypothetical protein
VAHIHHNIGPRREPKHNLGNKGQNKRLARANNFAYEVNNEAKW